MSYVNSDGIISKKPPFTVMVVNFFWGILNFFYVFFLTLINPDSNKHGTKYTTDYRPPGSGPPKPPTRKFGGLPKSSNVPTPGGCTSCRQ